MSQGAPSSETFARNRVVLESPDAAEVREVFQRLPRQASFDLVCAWDQRLVLQQTLLEAGAFALRIEPLASFREVRLTGLKGKSGPCYETGRRAAYLGSAAAAMDDDHHLLSGSLRVCEKTGGLYGLPPYQGLLEVTDPEPRLLARIESDPVPFDCNTFETDAARLAATAFAPAPSGGGTTAVFYPGPFSLLVLADGSVLRRGVGARVASALADDLCARDGLLPLPPHLAAGAVAPEDFPTAYRERGAGCLLGVGMRTEAGAAEPGMDVCGEAGARPRAGLAALDGVSDELCRRLGRLIEAAEPYFILTGSDPRDSHGCCPDRRVGEANRLVEAGVLECSRERAPAGGCTAGIYALAGEITVGPDGQPSFAVDPAARRTLAAALAARGRRSGRGRRLQAGLILLAAASACIGAWRAAGPPPSAAGMRAELAGVLGCRVEDPRLFVCLFRGPEECEACRAMSRLCRLTVEYDLAGLARAGRIAYREIPYARAGRNIRGSAAGAASTVGLVRLGTAEPIPLRLLTEEVWRLWPDETAFRAMLRQRICDQIGQDARSCRNPGAF
jgi:hypothetical protein